MGSIDDQPRPARRVAVCLSGVARNAGQNLKFMRTFLDGSGADVFFHLWETPDADLVVDALRPTRHVFESRAHAPPPAAPHRPEQYTFPSRLTNIPSMFYSVARANELKRAYEEEHGFRYDVVVRLRLDFFSVTTLAEILRRLPADAAAWERTVYVPDMAHAMGVNDQLGLGSSETMDVYASTSDRLREVEREDEMYVAEYVLLRHLIARGIRIRTFPLEYVLLPADPIATFDLQERISHTVNGWWSAPIPDVAPEDLETYLVATGDSFKLIDRLQLETPKAFRIRSQLRGYLQYDSSARRFSFTADASAASPFVVIVANDADRRAVNIRPRDVLLAKRDGGALPVINLRPDETGAVRVTGSHDDESAFLIAPSAGGITFEWRPGFWRAPWSAEPSPRDVGGRERSAAPAPARRERLYLQSTPEGLRLAPATDGVETFELERVPDATVEMSAFGLVGGVRVGEPRPGDPLVGRMVWMGYRAVRTIEERGPRVVLNQAVAFVRRRVAGESKPVRATKAPPERPRRERI